MKKVIATLGLSAFLVGCFDESKEKEMDSVPTLTEQTQTEEKNELQAPANNSGEVKKEDVDVKTEEKMSEAEEVAPEEKGDKPENTSDKISFVREPASSEVLQKVVSPTEKTENVAPVVAKFASGERIKAETLLTGKKDKSGKSGRNTYINVKTLNTPKQKVLVENLPGGTYENGRLISNFSLEELRVGAQIPMSAAEIVHQKVQCRYSNMSEKEMTENRCETKQATVSY